MAACDADDVDRAVRRRSRVAFESAGWSRAAAKVRKRTLLRFAELIDEQRELVAVLVDQLGEAKQRPSSAPSVPHATSAGLEGDAGATNGAVDVVGIASGHVCQHLAGCRVDAVERLPGRCVEVDAVDERAVADLDRGRAHADSAISSRYVIETRVSAPCASSS